MLLKEVIFILFAIYKNFDLIEENDTGIPSQDKLKTGDLLMREINSAGLYHAGIYNGKHVIDFTASRDLTTSDYVSSVSSSGPSGIVSMKSLKKFIANKPYIVFRLKKAIPENFSDLVEEAMDDDGIYNFLTNNCLHFALKLLGVKPAPIPGSFCLELFGDLLKGKINMEVLEEKGACIAIGFMLAAWKYGEIPVKQISVHFKEIQNGYSYVKPFL